LAGGLEGGALQEEVPMKLRFEYQKKNKNRISVFSGDEYLFSISETTFIREGFRNGMETANPEALKKSCQKSEAYSYCLNIMGKKDYTKKEIFDKLLKREVDKEIASEIVNELVENKYINENYFEEIFIKSKQDYKKDGFNKIRQDLYRRGIEINSDSYDFEAENENLKLLVKELLAKNIDDSKIIARLARKGYRISDIIEKIRHYKEFEGEEEYYDEC